MNFNNFSVVIARVIIIKEQSIGFHKVSVFLTVPEDQLSTRVIHVYLYS